MTMTGRVAPTVGDWLNGRALPWGGRGYRFDSCVPDRGRELVSGHRGIAQLAERLVRDQEVLSSSLSTPTTLRTNKPQRHQDTKEERVTTTAEPSLPFFFSVLRVFVS